MKRHETILNRIFKTSSPCWLILVFLVGPGSTNLLAQNDKSASEAHQKALKFIENEEWQKGYDQYVKAVNEEIAFSNPDHSFLGTSYDYLAKWNAQSQNFEIAQKFYTEAGLSHHRINDDVQAKNSFYQAVLLIDSIRVHNVATRTDFTDAISETVYFSVRSVTSVDNDTTWFVLDAGSNQGLTVDQRGWVLTRYDKESERGNQVFGSCGITYLYETYSVAWTIRSTESKAMGLELLDHDNVQLSCPVPQKRYRGILHELAKLNIYLGDDYKVPMYTWDQLNWITDRQAEEAFISAMRSVIYSTADYLYDSSSYSEVDYPDLAEGMFTGMNMWESMLVATNNDVKAFLRFVHSFPAKYMGKDYRIDETFATWVINHTPLADDEQSKLTKEFLNDSTNQAEWLADHHRLVVGGGLDFEKVSDHLYKLMADSTYEKVHQLSLELESLSKKLKKDSLLHTFMITRAQNLVAQKKYAEAIPIYNEILQRDTGHGNAYWFRAHASSGNEDFKQALADYQKIIDYYPDWGGGHAMYGWTLIKLARFPLAFDYCQKGYQLDSFNAAYTMNLGHAYLLTNRLSEARKFYLEALRLITETASFDDGMMDDFKIFLTNGWMTEIVKKERDFLTNEWNAHYKYKVLASENYDRGKKLEEEENYVEAAKAFDLAIQSEQKSDAVRHDWLRAYNRWAAYQYYKQKDYHRALERYQSGWEVNRNHLQDLEDEISDLESIGNIYSWLDDDLQKDMYRKMQYAAQRKLQTQSRSNNLYVISIGFNRHDNSGYAYAEQDATAICDVLREKGKLIFEQSVIKCFDSKNSSLSNLKKAFEEVIGVSRPGDCFVFYYTGYCPKDHHDRIIIGSDTIHNAELLGWLNLMQADKKLILMDAANTTLISEFSKQKADNDDLFDPESITLILSDGRVELPGETSGLFTSFLLKGLRGEAAVNWGSSYELESAKGSNALSYISAKGLEGYMYGKLNKGNLQFELKSYSEGADFPITFSSDKKYSGLDTIPPMIYVQGVISGAGKRGGESKTITPKGSVFGQVLDASGIAEVVVNGNNIEFSQNGKFELSQDFVNKWSKLVIRAKDKNGIWGADTFEVFGKEGVVNTIKGPNEDKKGATNYALLFGTNQYDHWSPLRNPINDVRKIGEILEREYGFEVVIKEDLTRQEMRKVLVEYFNKPYSSEDQLFVFFAGHGIHNTYLGGQIVCKDSKKSADDPTFDSYLSFEWVKSSLNNVYKCQHIMLTLDVCYGGAGFNDRNALYYGNSVEDIKKDPKGFYEQRMKYKTRLYLTSGDSTYVSDGSGNHSPFAMKFISTLNSHGLDKGGILTLTDFASNMRYTERGRQEIRYGSFGDSHLEGDFVFFYKGSGLRQNSDNLASGGVGSRP